MLYVHIHTYFSVPCLVMSKLTVNDLKKETRVTDKQLGQVCRKKHLKEIAQHVGNYPQFASKFDLPPPVASGIDTDLKLSYDQKAEKVFLYWRKNAKNPTYLTFVQACLELGEGGIARKMCKLSKGIITLSLQNQTSNNEYCYIILL